MLVMTRLRNTEVEIMPAGVDPRVRVEQREARHPSPIRVSSTGRADGSL
jgi:hypothetical protein